MIMTYKFDMNKHNTTLYHDKVNYPYEKSYTQGEGEKFSIINIFETNQET